jgi:hypothetical protein
MITADTLTDDHIAWRVREALERSTRGMETANDREFVRIYKMATLPHRVMPMLSAEDHAAVIATRRRLAEIFNDKCYPPIPNSTRVRATVRRSGLPDYTAEAIAARAVYDGRIGEVNDHHDGHGLCYGVKFEDGVVAFFDPEELEVQ